MKICVYAIACNEETNVQEWLDSVRDADEIYVLVNNSIDKTADLLRKGGAFVKEIGISPFRFDTARNFSLSMVSEDADLCVCLDLDERLPEGWELALTRNYNNEDLLYYNVPNGPNCYFPSGKIHKREGWKWVHACHEYLEWIGEGEPKKNVSDIFIEHKQDITKPRNYLPLLEMDTTENPNDARAWHYLGREYMFKHRYNDALVAFGKHLQLATWIEERCATMRFISRCYWNMKDRHQAKLWLYHACGECELREPYVDMAWILSQENDWAGVRHFAGKALSIDKPGSYPAEDSAWGGLPQQLYDLALQEEKNVTTTS